MVARPCILLSGIVRAGVEEGQFRPDVDADQFAYEFWGAMLAYHHASRLMRDPRARDRAQAAYDSLVRGARVDTGAARVDSATAGRDAATTARKK